MKSTCPLYLPTLYKEIIYDEVIYTSGIAGIDRGCDRIHAEAKINDSIPNLPTMRRDKGKGDAGKIQVVISSTNRVLPSMRQH